jgi:DNA polymerase I-like protein with 3'-5' exonuclease and polymerase domains
MDYSQQEFLIAALVSDDDNMIKAYQSGDVYLHTAKLAGAVPKDATKKTHQKERDLFKSTVLGIQYQMGANNLAKKITNDTGEPCSVGQAEDLIETFKDSYPDFDRWRIDNIRDYQNDGYLKLPCGWTLWGDNDNFRSVGNFPIQGTGSSIMRLAVDLAFKRGLTVIYTLHDALYVEGDVGSETNTIHTLYECMQDAFQTILNTYIRIRLDPAIWSNDYSYRDVSFKSKYFPDVKGYGKYIDPRAIEDYNKFKKYFFKDDGLCDF